MMCPERSKTLILTLIYCVVAVSHFFLQANENISQCSKISPFWFLNSFLNVLLFPFNWIQGNALVLYSFFNMLFNWMYIYFNFDSILCFGVVSSDRNLVECRFVLFALTGATSSVPGWSPWNSTLFRLVSCPCSAQLSRRLGPLWTWQNIGRTFVFLWSTSSGPFQTCWGILWRTSFLSCRLFLSTSPTSPWPGSSARDRWLSDLEPPLKSASVASFRCAVIPNQKPWFVLAQIPASWHWSLLLVTSLALLDPGSMAVLETPCSLVLSPFGVIFCFGLGVLVFLIYPD